MDDLRASFNQLDRIAPPDLWPEIERRSDLQMSDVPVGHTRWAVSPARSEGARTTWTISLPRLAVVGFIAVLGVGMLMSPPAQLLSPGASPSPDAGIVWDSGSVRLEADGLEIRAGDKVFTGAAPYAVRSDPGDPTSRTLEVQWTEDGLEQRLFLYFAADELDWWINEVRTRDGYPKAEWITYDEELLAATPRGETFVGDLHLRGGQGRVPGELTISGLRLTAFAPGAGPAALSDCENVRVSVRGADAEPLVAGQPLAGTGIEEMSPANAEALLREMGLCFTFRYHYPTTDDRSEGYAERWCTAPPAGSIHADTITYLESGEIVVFVWDDRVQPQRDQPPEGWGCPVG